LILVELSDSEKNTAARAHAIVDRLLTKRKVVSLENIDKSKIAASPTGRVFSIMLVFMLTLFMSVNIS
jgi:hypothetical protein